MTIIVNTTAEVIFRSNAPFEEYSNMIRSLVFERLVHLARPIVERNHSDLYHDALWLNKVLSGPMDFYYGVRPGGTCITRDLEIVEIIGSQTIYHVELSRVDMSWILFTETVAHDEATSRAEEYAARLDDQYATGSEGKFH